MKRTRRAPPKPEQEELIEEDEEEEEEEEEDEEEEDKDDVSSDEEDAPDDEDVKSDSGDEEEEVEESSDSEGSDPEDEEDCLPTASEEELAAAAQRIIDAERITGDVMTPAEWVRIVGTRAQQLAAGAKLMVRLTQPVEDPVAQAVLELEAKMTPLKLKRPLPDGRYEIWRIAELEIPPTSEMM